MSQDFYLGNNLKKGRDGNTIYKDQNAGIPPMQEDPVYFAMNYSRLYLDEGIVPFKMWDFQQN